MSVEFAYKEVQRLADQVLRDEQNLDLAVRLQTASLRPFDIGDRTLLQTLSPSDICDMPRLRACRREVEKAAKTLEISRHSQAEAIIRYQAALRGKPGRKTNVASAKANVSHTEQGEAYNNVILSEAKNLVGQSTRHANKILRSPR